MTWVFVVPNIKARNIPLYCIAGSIIYVIVTRDPLNPPETWLCLTSSVLGFTFGAF